VKAGSHRNAYDPEDMKTRTQALTGLKPSYTTLVTGIGAIQGDTCFEFGAEVRRNVNLGHATLP